MGYKYKELVTGDNIIGWTLVEKPTYIEKKKQHAYCRCVCGNERWVATKSLKNGSSTSCGCLGDAKRRLRSYESLYNWLKRSAAQRHIPVAMSYEEFCSFTLITTCHYCDAKVTWSEFNVFKKHKGGVVRYNLDRIDNKLPYTKDNCVVCCKRCNWGRGDSFSYAEWVQIGKLIASWQIA